MIEVVYKNPEIRDVTYPGVRKGSYKISEYGHVIRYYPNRYPHYHLTHSFENKYGYLQARIYTNDKNVNCFSPLVSRLVAWEFCDQNRDINLTVDHVDCNKLNNHYSNLEWVSNAENQRRAYLNKLNQNINSYKTEEQIHKVCELLSTTNKSYKEICESAGIENLNNNQSKGLCCDILSQSCWKDISSQYDFTNRLNSRKRFYTEKDKQTIRSMNEMGKSKEEIYNFMYGKNFQDATYKERDNFYHSLKRILQSSQTN